MPIRTLIVCGMFVVVCPVSAQVYYDDHYDGGHHGHSHSHGYISSDAPMVYQYGTSPYDAGPMHPARVYEGFASCVGTSVCPLQNGVAYSDSPQQYDQFGDQQYGNGQFGASPSHDGHIHDWGHAHNHGNDHIQPYGGLGSSLAPRGEAARRQRTPRNQVPFRDQVAPRMQTQPPSDRQRVAPSALPPASLPKTSQPQQLEGPLGDGPPPDTVHMPAQQRSPDRDAGSTIHNI